MLCLFRFFFNATWTAEIYSLSLHDALPISVAAHALIGGDRSTLALEQRLRRHRRHRQDRGEGVLERPELLLHGHLLGGLAALGDRRAVVVAGEPRGGGPRVPPVGATEIGRASC